jgi:hypothetical protein
MTGITMTKEEAERLTEDERGHSTSDADAGVRASRRSDVLWRSSSRDSAEPGPRSPAIDRTMQRAYMQADKSGTDEPPDRTLGTIRSPSAEMTRGALGATLPIVEEVGEAGSTGGRSGGSGNGDQQMNEKDGESSGSLRSAAGNAVAGIRHVPPEGRNGEQNGEQNDGSRSFLPDGPRLAPLLSASPPAMDSEKSLGAMVDRRPSPEGRHTA